MTEGPFLWYLNRATGVVLLVVLTLAVLLGVLAGSGRAGRGMPRFVTQALHRNLALLSLVALAVHVGSAVADTYVDIRWWQALVPAGATYQPVWLGLGTLALDLMAVIVLTSLLRDRLGHRAWRAVHLLSWPAWVLSVAHGVGIGTDLKHPEGVAVAATAACVAAVAVAVVVRLARLVRQDARERPAAMRSVA